MNTIHDLEVWLKDHLPEKYDLGGCCGAGGMGAVFQVHHRDWGISLALKVPRESSNVWDSKQFEHEADLWADLGLHPYVSTLYYARVIADRCCVFSELIEGGGLDNALRNRSIRASDEKTTFARVLSVAVSTAWGLDAAHSQGLVHCDFKPGNVLVESDFTAKITDFGLAQRTSGGRFATPGRTPLYASPEQARDEDLSGATDFWSWGATCFELFLNSPTWMTGAAAGAAFHAFCEDGCKTPGLPAIPRGCIDILRECFQLNPDLRPKSFGAIASALAELYESSFDEECPAPKPDPIITRADSLNNRGVSSMDLGQDERAKGFFREALTVDPFHPQALFNLHAVLSKGNPYQLSKAESGLLESARIDPHNPIQFELLARICAHSLRDIDANRYRKLWQARGEGAESFESAMELRPILSLPSNGTRSLFDQNRFQRLIQKSEKATRDGDYENGSRYAIMAGDLPGYSRHPHLQRLQQDIRNHAHK